MRHVSNLSVLFLASAMLGGCTYCEGLHGTEAWRPQIIPSARAATPPPKAVPPPAPAATVALPRFSLPDPPDCTVDGVEKPEPSSGEPGAHADPNLLEIARLEIERDCYKKAEEELRNEAERFQKAIEAMR